MGQFFDPINFGAGVATGVLSTLAVQRINRYVRSMNENRERALVRTFASREADEGYLQALVDYARRAHMMGHKVRLDRILVQPRFIPPPEVMQIPEEDVPLDDIYGFLPRVHDYPHLHAPYNIPTLSVADLSRGAKRIVIVGNQGSGRTTALLTIALWSAGFMEIEDEPDQILAELEEELDPKRDVPIHEQVLRVRRRIAMTKLTEGRMGAASDDEPVDPTEPSEEVLIEAPMRFRDMAPLYVHLADIVLDSNEYGREIDPSEPLIRALQRQAGWLSSRRLVNKTYKLLEEGHGLVLIDGYDDIQANKRPDALRWIRALMELYPDNFFIVTMPPEGYGLLMESGAVPVYIRPWDMQDIGHNVNKLSEQWERFTKNPIVFPRPEYETVDEYKTAIKRSGRQHLAMENTLRTWSLFKGFGSLGVELSYGEQMQAYLEDLLPKAASIMPELQRLATVQLDYGYITINSLIDYAFKREKEGGDFLLTRTMSMKAVSEPEYQGGEADYSEFFNSTGSDSDAQNGDATEKSAGDAAKDDEKLRKQIADEQGKLLEQLVKAGVLMPYRGGRYQFRHKILAAYLAARDLEEVREDIVYRKYLKPDWEYAINYVAGLRDVDFLVAEQLDNPLDVRLEHVLKLTRWLKFAGNEVSWRNNLLKYLGNLFAAGNQFSVVRERVAAALVGSLDEGARIVFRRALQTTTPGVRRLAALALGAMRDEGAIDALSQIVLQDASLENKIAAQMALIAIGSEDALLAAIDLMDVEGIEEVRRAVTESLASDNTIGYPTLRDMLESESISMRRAALYGMARVEREWSWLMIDRIFQYDTESFVRLAAEVVVRKKFDGYFYRLHAHPDVCDTDWFKEWEEIQRESGYIEYDMEKDAVVNLAFSQQEDPIVRWLMTGTYGHLGRYDKLADIYKALDDQEDMIRDTAYRALVEFQEQLGKPIPAPVG